MENNSHIRHPLQNIDSEKHVITNLTRFPVVTIEGNSVDSHLARAFLVKSPNVTIRNNRINASTQTAIKLGAELGWNESGPVDNVLIEDSTSLGVDMMPPTTCPHVSL